jgi:hypothetical protein
MAGAAIDHTPPRILAASVPVSRTVVAGATLPVSITFSEAVHLVGEAATSPTLRLDVDGFTFDAVYARGSGTRNLTFAFVVPAGLAGRAAGAGPIAVPAGTTLVDAAGNPARLDLPAAAQRQIGRATIDGRTPDVLVVGRPVVAPYGRGVSIVVRMTEPVVVRGKPTVRGVVGGTERTFVYAGGTGTDRLVFTCPSLRSVGPARFTIEPAIRTGSAASIRDRAGNAYGPAAIPPESLVSPWFSEFSRAVASADGVFDVFLQTTAATITVGGSRSGIQEVVTAAMPEYVPGFVQDTLTLLDPLLDVDFRLTSDRSRADIVLWIDTSLEVDYDGDVLGVALPTMSDDRIWWEIALNGPLVLDSPAVLRYVILHEFGHALGLEHTFDDSDGDSHLGTNPDSAPYADDTVLSYRGSRSLHLPGWYTRNDLAALQAIWGPEPAGRQSAFTPPASARAFPAAARRPSRR